MKSLILIFTLILVIFCSCKDGKKTIKTKDIKVKIQLKDLNEIHPNKRQAEWFLNNYKDEFTLQEKDSTLLKNGELIQKRYDFLTKTGSVSLVLIFCKNQKDAVNIGETNFSDKNDNPKMGCKRSISICCVRKR